MIDIDDRRAHGSPRQHPQHPGQDVLRRHCWRAKVRGSDSKPAAGPVDVGSRSSMAGDGDGAPAPMGGWQSHGKRKEGRSRASHRTASQNARNDDAKKSASAADRWVPPVPAVRRSGWHASKVNQYVALQ